MAKVSLQGVSKFYGKVQAVKKIDLEIIDKEFLVLVGPSGCGKSSSLRMIAGLEEIDEGIIKIGDKEMNNLEPRERNVSMVFQNYALYPHMTVEENLGFSLKIAGLAKKEIEERVKEAAGILDITEFLQRKPSQLSGGQRQRVAMGRAIVRRPDVFLFDEPLSNLDAKLRNQMRTEIKRLHQKVSTTIVYVTHDQVEAMTLADRIVIMKDGIIEQIGTPLDLFERPATQFVATFIGSPSMNMIKASIVKQNNELFMKTNDGIIVPVPKEKQNFVSEGQNISFGFRAEDIVPLKFGQKPSSAWEMQSSVNLAEPLGTETLIFTNFGEIEIVSRMFTPEQVKSNDVLDFALNLDRTYLFDENSGLAI